MLVKLLAMPSSSRDRLCQPLFTLSMAYVNRALRSEVI